VTHTAAIAAGPALLALAARLEDLDSDTVAGLHTPSLGGPIADLLDDPDGLVPRDEPESRRKVARVLLMIRTAQTAGLDTQQTVIRSDGRQRDLAAGKSPGPLEHERVRGG
jgi:hypothetical protein